VRLWLQYAGIALVAIAYLGGLIGWSYVSMKLDKDAAAAPVEDRLRVDVVAPAASPGAAPFPEKWAGEVGQR
jgi:hypothetical protein